MNIDLLLTTKREAGLIADKPFASPVAGVMYDSQTGLITLEFADADALDLNIAIEHEIAQSLSYTHEIHVAVIERGQITDSRQVPLILLNDPFGTGHFAVKPRRSVLALDNFMKRATSGQPVHREDLGNESAAGTVMGGVSGAVLQFAPQLARQRTMEAAPRAPGPAPHLAPGLGPKGNSGGARMPPRQQQAPPPRDEDEDY